MSGDEVKEVYTIVKGGAKDFWQKIGRACPNDDGSWNVYLNALPLTGCSTSGTPSPGAMRNTSKFHRGKKAVVRSACRQAVVLTAAFFLMTASEGFLFG